MNKTNIEWCTHTWNPVTGCLNNCEYCYARKMANRFTHTFIDGFRPTFHDLKLDEPQELKKQSNIFVCSMADLFGNWVLDEWIEKVFKVCEAAPWHRYLFLTKNPARYEELHYKNILPNKPNYWFGSTVTRATDEYAYFGVDFKCNSFVSVEPILEPMTELGGMQHMMPKWVIIGAETGNQKGKTIPKRQWIETVVNTCKEKNIPIFMKNSLACVWGEALIQEYPFQK